MNDFFVILKWCGKSLSFNIYLIYYNIMCRLCFKIDTCEKIIFSVLISQPQWKFQFMQLKYHGWHTAHVQMNGSKWFTAYINNTACITWLILFRGWFFFWLKNFLIMLYWKKIVLTQIKKKMKTIQLSFNFSHNHHCMAPVNRLAHVIMSNVASTDIKSYLRCRIRSMPLVERKMSHIRISWISLPALPPRHQQINIIKCTHFTLNREMYVMWRSKGKRFAKGQQSLQCQIYQVSDENPYMI